MNKVAILAFTDKGRALASKLIDQAGKPYYMDLFDNQLPAADYLKNNFDKFDTFLFISAAGIAVRMIAPLIKSKDIDPGVIVMDEMGKYIIPILSGHIGGSNEAAMEIGTMVGAVPVITTATDINSKFAVDNWAKKAGCSILDINKIKDISSEVLKGQLVGFKSDFKVYGNLPEELTYEERPVGICISFNGEKKPFINTFNLVPKIVTLGVGCRKNTDVAHFENEILKILAENNVSVRAIERVASIDIKKDETCILSFCEKYEIPFITYSAEQLSEAEGEYSVSEFVKSVTGVDNVCERSCKLASENGRIILSKTSGNGITAALARRDWKCEF